MVMEQLGHSQITLTANLYSHVAPALLKEAADRLQRARGGCPMSLGSDHVVA
jgi:integrase